MVTKTSQRKSSSKATKHAEAWHLGAIYIALGLIIATLATAVLYLAKNHASYADRQKVLAFESLIDGYLYEEFTVPGERTIIVEGSGVTEDRDLYTDFTIINYQGGTPVTKQPARVHFQCHDENGREKTNGCAHAYWYGDIVETTEEERTAWRADLDRISN